MRGFERTVARFVRDEGGAFALVFGVMALVLIALGGSVVDYVSLEQSRNRAQLALDAAALALQAEITRPGYDKENIRKRAEDLVRERIGNAEIRAAIDQIVIDEDEGSLFLSGTFVTQTAFVRLVGVPELGARISSEAVRKLIDIEVAVALDITGSMAGQRIIDLRAAATRLVDAVVQDDQSLVATKMALVPYAQSVNVSPFAQQVRGAVRDYVPVTTMSWAAGTTKTGAKGTRDSSYGVVIDLTNHGFSNGDWIFMSNISRFPAVNNKAFAITGVTPNSFRLVGAYETGSLSTATGAYATKCERANCEVMVRSPRHGYNNGEYVHVTDVGGMTSINNNSYQVRSATTDTLILQGSTAANFARQYVAHTPNTGRLHCTWQTTSTTCTYYRFNNMNGGTNTLPLSQCATERATGATSDQPFSTTFAGRNYPGSNNPCIASPIVPLTDDKAVLKDAITRLNAAGSTSGSLGIAWAWHMLSPKVGSVWPGKGRPGTYEDTRLMKAAIIMTDGDFNTVHCNGVVSRTSTGGSASGSEGDKIACDAHGGAPYVQARAYCDAMKATGKIDIYTVGFGISEGSAAAAVLSYCASSAANYYLAEKASELDAAFQQIASNISALRIAR